MVLAKPLNEGGRIAALENTLSSIPPANNL